MHSNVLLLPLSMCSLLFMLSVPARFFLSVWALIVNNNWVLRLGDTVYNVKYKILPFSKSLPLLLLFALALTLTLPAEESLPSWVTLRNAAVGIYADCPLSVALPAIWKTVCQYHNTTKMNEVHR